MRANRWSGWDGYPLVAPPLAFVAVQLLSRNYACAACGAAILSVPAFVISRAVLEWATRRRMLSGKAQLALAVVIGAAFALCYPFRLTNTRAFKIAFGKPPPADIKIEHADCYYYGGGGDYGLYLAFTGSEARIEELLAGCELVRDESAEESGHYDALYFPHPDWASVESGGPWQVYKSPMNSTATWMRRGVFIYAYWDRRSNRVILAYLMG